MWTTLGWLGGTALVAFVGAWRWRRSRHWRTMRRWRVGTERWLKQPGRKLDIGRFLGAGNIGAVWTVRLRPGWEEDIGLKWKATLPMPETVALKLCFFHERENRMTDLIALAGDVDRMLAEGKEPALCPFLAIGEKEVPGMGRAIVEAMPTVDGPTLRDAFRRDGYRPSLAVAKRELHRMIGTFLLLESYGWYSRNLDSDNIMVQKDGTWIRIDFDAASRDGANAGKRLRRLCELTEEVLRHTDGVPDSAAVRELRSRLQQMSMKNPGPMKEPIGDIEDLLTAIDGIGR